MMILLALPLLAVVAPFLVLSGVAKLVALDDAPRTLSALRLPTRAPRTTVAAVALVETTLGLLMLLSDGQTRVAATVLTTLLLAGFTVIVARAATRGSVEDCGCLGRWDRTPVSALLVRRNAVFTLAAVLLATLCATVVGAPSALALAWSSPVPVLTAAGAGWVLAAAGLAAARASRRGGLPSPDVLAQRPGLIREDGLVIDVVTEAVRGRGQFLLFAQPHCERCTRTTALLDAHHDTLSAFLDVRVVYAVGTGQVWNAPARACDGPRTGAALDLGGALAQALDVRAERPVGVLIATSGRPVLPYANGEDEVAGLVDALVASRA
ncbi:MauE/DoxX family redox-associated membrane protein [Microbacterium sp. NPDC090007]|uniref:MauE/DoxX family redox-associated membrane protein n=1 Tax=Microbacterium sp. NPDC090007 TaxID=3364204 RepID=UPI0037FEF85F